MSDQGLVTLADIYEARKRLEGVAVTTPLDVPRALSDRCAGPAFVKCENLQRTGSFKIRGAYNLISRLSADERAAGVVAASAGNHAQGVALAASLSDTPATVFMPEAAPIPKVQATKRYGAKIELTGKDVGDAFVAANEFAERTGAVFVHPFDHPHVIAGQGTAGLEIVEQMDEIGTVVVPVGGGGLISGIAAAIRGATQGVRIVGVQAKGAAAFPPSLEKGSPITLESMSTIADGIASNFPGDLPFRHVQEQVDEVVTVTDEAIAEALVFSAERMKLVLEPAGAAGMAAVLQEVTDFPAPVVVVLSGGNIDPLLLLRVIRFGLSSAGRYFAFNTRMPDRPGELYRLLGLIAGSGANIVGIDHHRVGMTMTLEQVEVALQVETRGPDHIKELVAQLEQAGYEVDRA